MRNVKKSSKKEGNSLGKINMITVIGFLTLYAVLSLVFINNVGKKK